MGRSQDVRRFEVFEWLSNRSVHLPSPVYSASSLFIHLDLDSWMAVAEDDQYNKSEPQVLKLDYPNPNVPNEYVVNCIELLRFLIQHVSVLMSWDCLIVSF